MWEEPKKMDDPEVFRDALISSGLDADKLIARCAGSGGKKQAGRELPRTPSIAARSARRPFRRR